MVQQRIRELASVDLIEDGFIQASRALSDERKDYIASLLKNSLTSDDLKHLEYKRLLSLLGDLNDLEILILKSKELFSSAEEENAFFAKHRVAVAPQFNYDSQEDLDRETIFKAHRTHLVNLELLIPRFKKAKRGDFPEFDEKTGMIKSNGFSITPLGRLLLKSIDLME